MVLFTVKKLWSKPTALDFNAWVNEKTEAHDLMKNTAIKTKNESTINQATKTKVASKAFAANTQQKSHQKLGQSSSTSIVSCIYTKAVNGRVPFIQGEDSHAAGHRCVWSKAVFLVFVSKSCLGNTQLPFKCRKDGCDSSHNTLLHGAGTIVPAKAPTNANIKNSNSNAGSSRSTIGQQQPSKTTTLSFVTENELFLWY